MQHMQRIHTDIHQILLNKTFLCGAFEGKTSRRGPASLLKTQRTPHGTCPQKSLTPFPNSVKSGQVLMNNSPPPPRGKKFLVFTKGGVNYSAAPKMFF
jgi:hypothetical protein